MDRADALNDAIDALLAGREIVGHDAPDDLRPLLDEGRALLRHRPPESAPSASFLLGLEAQLRTDLRLRASSARPRRRSIPGAAALGLLLVGAWLLGAAGGAWSPVVVEPLRTAWDELVLAVGSGPDARVRGLLDRGWRSLEAAEDADRDGRHAAAERALESALGRYRRALAAAEDAAVDPRVRSQAHAEARLVAARLGRRAHGLPVAERAPWIAARLALARLLVADLRIVHLPADGASRTAPELDPPEQGRVLPSPTATGTAPSAAPSAPPATVQPTREAWPTPAATASSTPPIVPPASPTAEEPAPAPATAERARPPATATPMPTAEPTGASNAPATPTADRWPTSTPRPVEPGAPTSAPPQPTVAPGEPTPIAP